MTRCSPEIPNIACVYRTLLRASILIWILALGSCTQDPGEISEKSKEFSAYERITGLSRLGEATSWNQMVGPSGLPSGSEPTPIIKELVNILPVGRALDLGFEDGRNAVFLAKKGFVVDGVGVSPRAVRMAERLAAEHNANIAIKGADPGKFSIGRASYDTIININYLSETLLNQVVTGLKTGGVFVLEAELPKAPARFTELELDRLFQGFQMIHRKKILRTGHSIVQRAFLKTSSR